jgi:tetratricopeptide (TPR) repeat protein
VGRTQELRKLEGFLASLAAGTGGFLLIRGEAGIGKTRLLEEAARRARDAGIAVFWRQCQEIDRSAAYAPWRGFAREIIEGLPRSRAFEAVEPRRSAVLKLVPELGDRIWLYSPSERSGGEAERGAFLESLAGFLYGLADASPLLLVLDDLPFADESSVDLLQVLVRDLARHPLGILASARDSDLDAASAVTPFLTARVRDPATPDVAVGPLEDTEVTELLDRLPGAGRVAPGVRRRIVERSGGNPYFAAELLRSVEEEDSGAGRATRAGVPAIPASVRNTVLKRIRQLDTASQRVLGIASLLGVDFSAELLEATADEPGSAILDALEAASVALLIRDGDPSVPGTRFAFVHPLVREVLAGELGAVRARRIHLRAATALETSAPGTPGRTSAAMAYHFLRGGDPGSGARYSLTAADEAVDVFARSEAIGHYRSALEILEKGSDTAAIANVRSRLALQLRALGDTAASSRLQKAAADEFESVHQGPAAATCLIWSLWDEELPHAGTLPLLERARRLLGEPPAPADLLRWQVARAHALYELGRVEDATQAALEAERLLPQVDDPVLLVESLVEIGPTLPIERRDDWPPMIERAVRIAEEHHLTGSLARVRLAQGVLVYHGRGDVRATEDIQRAGLDAARRGRSPTDEWEWTGLARPWVDLRAGDFEEALRLSREWGEWARSAGFSTLMADGFAGCAAVSLGEDMLGTEYLERAIAELKHGASWYAEVLFRDYLGRMHLRRSELGPALSELRRAHRVASGAGLGLLHGHFNAEVLALLIRAESRAGKLPEAAGHLDELREIARRLPQPHIVAFLRVAEGEQAARSGEPARAAPLLRDGARRWEVLGWGFEEAHAWETLGGVERARGQAGAARTAWRRAADLYRRASARRDLERVKGQLGETPRERSTRAKP